MSTNRDEDDLDGDTENDGKAGRPDFLDFLIKVLQEHEQQLSSTTENLGDLYDRMKNEIEATITPTGKPQLVIRCNRWQDMQRNRKGSRVVTFAMIGNRFVVTMVADEIYEYVERLPTKRLHVRETQGKYVLDRFLVDDLNHIPLLLKTTLDCGLPGTFTTTYVDLPEGGHIVTMQFTVDRQTAITFLAKELQVPETKVIEGRVLSMT